MTKLDLKTLDSYRAKAGELRILEVPPLQYLMLDGHGDPNTAPEYADALGALYPMAYGLKFASKNELGRDYVVPPLEGLWWADDMSAFTTARDKSAWSWTLLLLVPEWISAETVEVVREAARAKPAVSTTALERVRLETLDEGLCVQTLHVGSFEAEGPVLDDLHHRFIPEHGLVLTGKHHEIYLSDVRKVAPEKLRTILRQPVERAAGSS
ncbi:GyrI-like domain-containing protein [Cellulomonas fimi]|uniref:GyrI-like small molecule binding domain-containing protein n=1 Tax=Cellulomonas fimi TaxID=1708 RepID=A0A7Y0LY15_CELFI|nr:GyrI-like domain-containing protein [Cellulomonas fimi]NMR20273.1 hypothetical protein [Cellulomonas fimi]